MSTELDENCFEAFSTKSDLKLFNKFNKKSSSYNSSYELSSELFIYKSSESLIKSSIKSSNKSSNKSSRKEFIVNSLESISSLNKSIDSNRKMHKSCFTKSLKCNRFNESTDINKINCEINYKDNCKKPNCIDHHCINSSQASPLINNKISECSYSIRHCCSTQNSKSSLKCASTSCAIHKLNNAFNMDKSFENNLSINSSLKSSKKLSSSKSLKMSLKSLKSSKSSKLSKISSYSSLDLLNKPINLIKSLFSLSKQSFNISPCNYQTLLVPLLLVLCTVIRISDACSARSTPKPRPPLPEIRPNITFQTFQCPEAYAKWYCLNGATCFFVRIGESIIYNCECADGYMGQRCEFKDLEGSYLQSREKVLVETAQVAGGAFTILVVFVFVALIFFQNYKKSSRTIDERTNRLPFIT